MVLGMRVMTNDSRGHNEDPKHYAVKKMIDKILTDNGRDSFIEVLFANIGAQADVFDLDNRTIYEVQKDVSEAVLKEKAKQFSHKLIADYLIIDLNKVPDNMAEAYEYLKKLIL